MKPRVAEIKPQTPTKMGSSFSWPASLSELVSIINLQKLRHSSRIKNLIFLRPYSNFL